MKIVVIAPTPFFADRGTHIRIWEEAYALEQLGHTIHIVTYHIGNAIEKKFASAIKIERIHRFLFWYKKMEAGPSWQKIALDILLIKKTWSCVRKQQPDVIHAHLHEGVLIAWIVQKLFWWKKIRVIADFHGSLVEEMRSHQYIEKGIRKKIFSFLERWIHTLGDTAIASSWETAENVKKDRKKNVTIILDGVDQNRYTDLPEKKILRKKFHLPEKEKILVYTGALVQNKGIEYLLDALETSIAAIPNIHIVLAGYPADQVRALLKTKKYEKKISLISPLSYVELPELLHACDIAIDPKDSHSKQASGKILQYMAGGLPIICFDRENNRQYLAENAFYASEISSKGLTDAIIKGCESEAEADRFAENNKKRVEAFSWAASAKQLVSLYTK